MTGGHKSASAAESPPEPGLCTGRCSANDCDRLRKMRVANVQTAAADEIRTEELTAQLVAVVSSQDIIIGIGIEIAGLQYCPKRLQRLARRIRAVPHELADERITLVEVVTYAPDCSPAGGGYLRRGVQRHIDHEGNVAVDFAVVSAPSLFHLCGKRLH